MSQRTAKQFNDRCAKLGPLWSLDELLARAWSFCDLIQFTREDKTMVASFTYGGKWRGITMAGSDPMEFMRDALRAISDQKIWDDIENEASLK